MVRIAIVEDEKIYANKLREYLMKFEEENNIEIESVWFNDGIEIVDDYKADVDIIFMDIQMKFMDGMSAAKKIRKADKDVIIIFITNSTGYAVHGYEVEALDYIVKPVTYFSFSEKLDRAIKRIPSKNKHYISVSVDYGIKKLEIESIYYIESRNHDLLYKLEDLEIKTRGTLQQVENLLTNYGFYRSSKSYLVNMRYVDGIKDNFCIMRDEQIPISRNKKKEFMQILLNYMSEVM